MRYKAHKVHIHFVRPRKNFIHTGAVVPEYVLYRIISFGKYDNSYCEKDFQLAVRRTVHRLALVHPVTELIRVSPMQRRVITNSSLQMDAYTVGDF